MKLTILPSLVNSPQSKNAYSPLANFSVGSNFCNQPNAIAGAFYNIDNNSSEIISMMKPVFSTIFYEGGAGIPFSDFLTAMNNSNLTHLNQPIELNVPSSRELEVGMMGVFKLGDPTGLNECDYSSYSHKYVTFSGSRKITPNANMVVPVPLITAPSKNTLYLANGKLDTNNPLTLATAMARKEYMMFWVKLPQDGCSSGNNLMSLKAKVVPGVSSAGLHIEMELEKNLTYGNSLTALPSATLPGNNSTGSYFGYLIPHGDQYEFSISYTLKTSVSACGTSTAAITKTVICSQSIGGTHLVPGSFDDGIRAALVDFSIVAPVCADL